MLADVVAMVTPEGVLSDIEVAMIDTEADIMLVDGVGAPKSEGVLNVTESPVVDRDGDNVNVVDGVIPVVIVIDDPLAN